MKEGCHFVLICVDFFPGDLLLIIIWTIDTLFVDDLFQGKVYVVSIKESQLNVMNQFNHATVYLISKEMRCNAMQSMQSMQSSCRLVVGYKNV